MVHPFDEIVVKCSVASLEDVFHGPTFFSYLVFVLFMVELVDEFDHLLGFRLGIHAVNELPLDVLQACYSCYIGEIIALYLSVEACRIAVHGLTDKKPRDSAWDFWSKPACTSQAGSCTCLCLPYS